MTSYCVIPGERACEEKHILSARDTTRSGYQTGASLVVTQGYVRKVIKDTVYLQGSIFWKKKI